VAVPPPPHDTAVASTSNNTKPRNPAGSFLISGRIQLATRLEIQQSYLTQVYEEVSPVIAVQFIQLQRRFETELETERMKYSPIAE
jgi:hypothetical protein